MPVRSLQSLEQVGARLPWSSRTPPGRGRTDLHSMSQCYTCYSPCDSTTLTGCCSSTLGSLAPGCLCYWLPLDDRPALVDDRSMVVMAVTLAALSEGTTLVQNLLLRGHGAPCVWVCLCPAFGVQEAGGAHGWLVPSPAEECIALQGVGGSRARASKGRGMTVWGCGWRWGAAGQR